MTKQCSNFKKLLRCERRIKVLFLYLIVSITLLNSYFLYQLQQNSIDGFDNGYKQPFHGIFQQNEFLVLDWTGHQHIFKEKDPIKCDFSHITPDYCHSKFESITNTTFRLYLIKRCSRLSTLIIRWTADRAYLKQADLIAYHSIHMPSHNFPKLERNYHQQQYTAVYVLESEVYSSNRHNWHEIDFPMWYNLERSYPEPATYFNLNIYLNQLFAAIQVTFSRKVTTAPIIWIISNCKAYNSRQFLVEQLMSYIRIDSFGGCLNNIKSSQINLRRQSNSVLYASYKFVIAIENSNCEDYVTEKLIDALSSTAIPIVASRNGKPDYLRFAPKYSYINVYDYKSVKELADYLKYLSGNETAYNEYLWFRQLPANKYASLGITNRSLTENLRLAHEILGVNATMCKWLLTKEASINKYCKLAKFIHTTDWKLIYKHEKMNRPTAKEVCLPRDDIAIYFTHSSTGYLRRALRFF